MVILRRICVLRGVAGGAGIRRIVRHDDLVSQTGRPARQGKVKIKSDNSERQG